MPAYRIAPRLPARKAGSQQAPANAPSPAAAGVDPPLRVWVVDDDTVVALYLSELLREHGCEVSTFADPQRALFAFEGDPGRVDVVITDQCMPVLCGDGLARAMLALRPRLRVILCTGYSDLVDEQAALAIGVQHFFRKPFDARALLSAVRGDDAA